MATPSANLIFPTADQVARILIAACREADFPLDQLIPCLSAPQQKGGSWHFGRVRACAALALRRMFPDLPALAIGRMVGTRKKDYLGDLERLLARAKRAGVDPEALKRIIAAGYHVAIELPKFIPAKPFSRGDTEIPPSKREMRNQLHLAVVNTAKLPSQN